MALVLKPAAATVEGGAFGGADSERPCCKLALPVLQHITGVTTRQKSHQLLHVGS